MGIEGGGVLCIGELASEINAEAAAVSDMVVAFCCSSNNCTIHCSIAVEALGGATGVVAVMAGGEFVGVVPAGVSVGPAVDGSSVGYPVGLSTGNILVRKIAKKIKTQSPNHLIREIGISCEGVEGRMFGWCNLKR